MRYLSILFLLLSAYSNAQDSVGGKWMLKMHATSPIDIFTFPTLQFSLERSIGKRFSIAGEYGFQPYPNRFNIDTAFVSNKGMKYAVEMRFYTGASFSFKCGFYSDEKLVAPYGIYCGIQLFHTDNQYNESQKYNPITDTLLLNLMEDFFSVRQKKTGARFVLGIQSKVCSKVYIDMYGGLGIKHKKVTNQHREYDPAIHIAEECIDLCFDYYDLSESSGIKFSLSCGIRLGVNF